MVGNGGDKGEVEEELLMMEEELLMVEEGTLHNHTSNPGSQEAKSIAIRESIHGVIYDITNAIAYTKLPEAIKDFLLVTADEDVEFVILEIQLV
ncbi:uncharacterized protein G2W53_011657 [Senna tora]|uniref:Uncharacterized protein n=1 Tax=Senna tora TaxID=362788 RepID=A0A834X1P0_9FABA|nr:uncharacterized protein G2W53_011657 [Senna tora]